MLLLTPQDPPPFRRIAPTRDVPFLLVSDHGSNRIPAALHDLGVSEEDRARHIGHDIGAERVTELVAAKLGAGAILATFSRLVIDLNRDPHEATCIPEISDGTFIPGNLALTSAARQARIDEIHAPYHAAIEEELKELEKKFPHVTLIALHSFTPALRSGGSPRPWHIGVPWKHDPVTAQKAIAYLRHNTRWHVGDNEPYSMLRDSCFTLKRHADEANRPALLIEMRQNEIAHATGQETFAQTLAALMEGL